MTAKLTANDLGIDEQEEGVLDVHDLPQIYTKPSAQTLLDALALLSVVPSSWEGTPALTPGSATPQSASGTITPALKAKLKIRSEGVPGYLTQIVASPLAWIIDDEEKERVWDTASARLSERSGRTAVGAISRTFRVPTTANGTSHAQAADAPTQEQDTSVEIEIHEPSLTEDHLGLKTWASSYVLARKWLQLRHVLPLLQQISPQILELGAGTGLVGIAAALMLGAHVLLTDLPDIVTNLERNANSNAHLIAAGGGSVRVAVLDWSAPWEVRVTTSSQQSECAGEPKTNALGPDDGLYVPLIVSADPIYSPEHPALLAKAIKHHLSRSKDARVVVEMPIREAYAAERADFCQCMQGIGLVLVREETDIGYDDWSEGREEELSEVECWMTIWAWPDQ